jgi:16S rRNA (adenine1518-N6/adenine1519-N6)-dimethyltransferase
VVSSTNQAVSKGAAIMTSPHTLLKGWNLQPRKALGQNFLKNTLVAQRLVEQAQIGPQDTVLEIGAGLGSLTLAIAGVAGQVIAVEKDAHLVPLLRAELLSYNQGQVRILETDILRMPLAPLVSPGSPQLIVLGNLPYNISSQVVVKLITERRFVRRAVLMFQKELAERLCAGPGSKTYGRLSVLLQYCADVEAVLSIKADQFYPKPKVDSAVLRIDFKPIVTPAVQDEGLLVKVVQAAFGRRRKTMRNALTGSLLDLNADQAESALQAVSIDPRRRAETLSVAEFVALTNHVALWRPKVLP